MKELFLYSGFYDETISLLLTQMQEAGDSTDITIRVNTGGGSVFAAWGLFAEIQKRKGQTILQIDGNASSIAFIMMLYCPTVKILDTTKSLIHRAEMYSDDEEDLKMLKEQNDKMQAAIMSKIDAKIFEKRTGVSIEQIFNPLTRVEVWINAEDMVAIGLVKKENVTTLTPVLSEEIKSKTGIILEAYRERTSAPTSDITVTGSQYVNNLTNNNNKQSMEATEKEAIILAEKNRVEAWMVWAEVDLAKVKAGIDSGKEISAKETQEFVLAMNNMKNLEALKANSAGKVETPKTEPTAEQIAETEYKQAEEALNASLGLKTKEVN